MSSPVNAAGPNPHPRGLALAAADHPLSVCCLILIAEPSSHCPFLLSLSNSDKFSHFSAVWALCRGWASCLHLSLSVGYLLCCLVNCCVVCLVDCASLEWLYRNNFLCVMDVVLVPTCAAVLTSLLCLGTLVPIGTSEARCLILRIITVLLPS
jgi:hypothetical protein